MFFSFYVVVDIVTTKRDKRALVFVNPAGGAGKAYRLVMEYVVGVWSEAEFSYHMIVTGSTRKYYYSLLKVVEYSFPLILKRKNNFRFGHPLTLE